MSQPTPLLSRLPLELWEHVIREHFGVPPTGFPAHPEAYKDLSSFSIACGSHVLLDSCRKVLFSRAEIVRPAQAERLVEVYEEHPELVSYLVTLCIVPDGPVMNRNYWGVDYESDEEGDECDENEDQYQADEEDGEENEEQPIWATKWEEDESPFEHSALLSLLALLSAPRSTTPNLRNLALLGTDTIREHFHEKWSRPALQHWRALLALPSIRHLSLVSLCWPHELLGRSPGVEELVMHRVHITLPGTWRSRCAKDPFPRLRSLDVLQKTEMGVGLSELVRFRYVEEIKSKTFETLRLAADGDRNWDSWAWMESLGFFGYFGSNTLTTLELTVPFGYFPDNEYPDEVSGHIAQLAALEHLTLVFTLVNRRGCRPTENLEHLGNTAFTPYVPVVMRGVAKTRPPLKIVTLVIRDASPLLFTFTDEAEKTTLCDDSQTFLSEMVSAPIWTQLDGWLAGDLSSKERETEPVLRVHIECFQRYIPPDFGALFAEPLVNRMPKLCDANKLEIALGVLPW